MGKELLTLHHQEHLLKIYGELSIAERSDFMRQIEDVDWDTIESWSHQGGGSDDEPIEPIDILSVAEIERKKDLFYSAGKQAIQKGKIGCVLLAGGQGTRLGCEGPKGIYDIGITHPVYIFELLIKNLLDVCRDCAAYPPLFIMTSEKNDFVTRAFFAEHDYFGYPSDKVRFFVQNMAPSVDLNGKLLLESRGRLALSPNGNGGWYESLEKSGAATGFPEIEWYNVFSVDNVLQRIADPVFVGATILSRKNCAAKGVRKTYPEEKVGVLCKKGGLPTVIEYYELDEKRANLRDGDGNLVYSFGMTLNYLFNVEKLREVAEKKIPVHVVKKKVPYLDENGQLVEPTTNNAYKFETLILDLVRYMKSCLAFEVVREKEFAPVKNKEGTDSVDTARELLKINGVEL